MIFGKCEAEPLTVYELCGESMYLVVNSKNDREVTMQIYDEEDHLVFDEDSHNAGWESMVKFAKRVLECDKKITKQRDST